MNTGDTLNLNVNYIILLLIIKVLLREDRNHVGGRLAGFPGYFVGVLHPGVRGTTSEDLDQPQLTHEGSQGLC